MKSVRPMLLLCAALASPAALAANTAVGTALVPAGTPFSPGLLSGDTLSISGLQGTDAAFNLPASFDEEARNCLENVGRVLKGADMGFDNVVSVEIYLTDMRQFDAVNALYKTYFKAPFPARTTVQVGRLSHGARIEIAAVARR